jgi:urocanate hydratase
MTAGSYMYIGPQGIVHGTTITILNAARMIDRSGDKNKCKLFVSSGLGGMSGAQPKAASIAGVLSVVAEINPKALNTRYSQGWVDEVFTDLNKLVNRVRQARAHKEILSIAYGGNIVDVWEKFADENIFIDLGSDQTSLHNPWSGGYYPAGLSFEESNGMMSDNPEMFRDYVHKSLRRQVTAINRHSEKGTYFFDYGNAFLLEASRAGADVLKPDGEFRYPSYVQDIMGPMCFDYGFGPFRWVCCSNKRSDLDVTDTIAKETLENLIKKSPDQIKQQLRDNIRWIEEAGKNNLVVGSQARILYADAEGRVEIASAFNRAISKGLVSAPIVIGRDHHDVSGTDSPYRETSDIYDGSKFTADMAVQNVIGDSFRGATWVSLHNGGGVGWGEVINGGFGMVLEGSDETESKLRTMLHWDVNNGIARRSWARNKEAIFTLKREMERTPGLEVTIPVIADDEMIDEALKQV